MRYLTSNEMVAARTAQQSLELTGSMTRDVVPHLAIVRDTVAAVEAGVVSYTAALRKHVRQFAGAATLEQLISVHTVRPEELSETVDVMSARQSVHGVLVMSPTVYDYDQTIEGLDPRKDVDRMREGTRNALRRDGKNASPATPLAVRQLLEDRDLWSEDLSYTLVGRGVTVGSHVVAHLEELHGSGFDSRVNVITRENAGSLPEAIRESNVVIVAAGRRHQIEPQFIHPDLQAIVGVCIEDIDPAVYQAQGDLLVTPRHNDENHRGIGAITSANVWGNTLAAAAIEAGLVAA